MYILISIWQSYNTRLPQNPRLMLVSHQCPDTMAAWTRKSQTGCTDQECLLSPGEGPARGATKSFIVFAEHFELSAV